MSTLSTVSYSGRVVSQKRLLNSSSGNPRWSFTLDDGRVFHTDKDAAFASALIESSLLNHWVRFNIRAGHVVGYTVFGKHATPLPSTIEVAAQEADRRYPPNRTVDDPFGATGEAQTDPYGYDEHANTAFRDGAAWQELRMQNLVHEVTLLWDARISQGMPFLNAQEDVQPLRDILEQHKTPLLREALLDAVTEALQDAADDFPDDLPGRALVAEWLEERAAKYRSGELDVL